ncbi:glutamate--cysteine ligase [bacterium SCSIO 12696]|nr:glutamate--cysteine ligase [bacterium SCSIO 12696]
MQQRLALLKQPGRQKLLAGIRHGVEKESLRVTPDGQLALTPHPQGLGSALAHPSITTDFSEALLEFITEPSDSHQQTINYLEQLHRYTYRQIGDELLWANSMPCVLGADEDIPEARYGSSNVGTMKQVYRIGLGHRYGRLMQTIAGIHYNFSLPDSLWELLQQEDQHNGSLTDYKTEGYLGLIRNFRRYFWLLMYLFGASPAVCRSFAKNRNHQLSPIGTDHHSLHSPQATSLRMGDLGYQSSAQDELVVCYNTLDQYITTLRSALSKPYPDYEQAGLKNPDGSYRQLNTHLLQIENEFYSPIRPKRTTHSGEPPVRALWERGIEYIEVRCLDLNPLLPVGIDARQMRFVDTFLVMCLLNDSPTTYTVEYYGILENQRRMVYRGRDPELTLLRNEVEVPLQQWGQELFAAMAPVAKLLDNSHGGTDYSEALTHFARQLNQPELTLSAGILADIEGNQSSYFRRALAHSRQHREYFMDSPLDPAVEEQLQQQAQDSLAKQRDIEAADNITFEEFLANYYRGCDFSL